MSEITNSLTDSAEDRFVFALNAPTEKMKHDINEVITRAAHLINTATPDRGRELIEEGRKMHGQIYAGASYRDNPALLEVLEIQPMMILARSISGKARAEIERHHTENAELELRRKSKSKSDAIAKNNAQRDAVLAELKKMIHEDMHLNAAFKGFTHQLDHIATVENCVLPYLTTFYSEAGRLVDLKPLRDAAKRAITSMELRGEELLIEHARAAAEIEAAAITPENILDFLQVGEDVEQLPDAVFDKFNPDTVTWAEALALGEEIYGFGANANKSLVRITGTYGMRPDGAICANPTFIMRCSGKREMTFGSETPESKSNRNNRILRAASKAQIELLARIERNRVISLASRFDKASAAAIVSFMNGNIEHSYGLYSWSINVINTLGLDPHSEISAIKLSKALQAEVAAIAAIGAKDTCSIQGVIEHPPAKTRGALDPTGQFDMFAPA